jgi:hypothetical protein
MPVDGDMVVVPTGQTLLIDMNTPILKMLLIKGENNKLSLRNQSGGVNH